MNNPQYIAKTIKDETKKQKIQVGKMLEDCGISKNALSSMNAGYFPQLENIVKIADYLGVSTDFLLGRSEQKEKAPDSDIRSVIVQKISGLSDHQAAALLAFLESLQAE